MFLGLDILLLRYRRLFTTRDLPDPAGPVKNTDTAVVMTL